MSTSRVAKWEAIRGLLPSGALRRQRTIRHPLTFTGTGLFTGQAVNATLVPAPAHTGVQIARPNRALGATQVVRCVHENAVPGTSSRTSVREGALLAGDFSTTAIAAEESMRIARGAGHYEVELGAQDEDGAEDYSTNSIPSSQPPLGLSDDPDAEFGCVEHVMAALAVAGVDNCTVWLRPPGDPETDAGSWGDPSRTYEPPSFGGSIQPYLEGVLRGGFEDQGAARKLLVVRRPIEVRVGDSWARLEPHPGFELNLSVDYGGRVAEGPLSERRDLSLELLDESADAFVSATDFLTDFATARTFSYQGARHPVSPEEICARGGVFHGDGGARVSEGARQAAEDEHARHKVIDAIGDLYLAGGQIVGKFTSEKPAHATTRKLLRNFLADPRLNFYEVDVVKV